MNSNHVAVQLIGPVIELSIEVGHFLRRLQKDIVQDDIQFKGRSNDMVSRADKEAERRFVDGLAALLPDSGFIAEEGTSNKKGKDFNWIIDPLDGTTNYLYGIPFYCTSVALRQKDEIVLGVIYDPVHEECFSAVSGQGAKLNGKPIGVSRQQDLSKSLIALGFPYNHRDKLGWYLDILDRVTRRTRGVRRPGAAALDMAYLACGRFEAFYEYGLNPWDVAAGSIIIKEAGGHVSDFAGGSDYIFGENILCSNGHLHKQVMHLLNNQLSS